MTRTARLLAAVVLAASPVRLAARPADAPPLAGARVVHEEEARSAVAVAQAREEAAALRSRLAVTREAEASVLGEIGRLDQRRALSAVESREASLVADAAERAAFRARERAELLARRVAATRDLLARVADALYRSGEGDALRRALRADASGADQAALVAVGRHRRLAAELREASVAAGQAAVEAEDTAGQALRARELAGERLEALAEARRLRQLRLVELRGDAARTQSALGELASAQGALQDSLAGRRPWGDGAAAPRSSASEWQGVVLPGVGPAAHGLAWPVPGGSGDVVGRFGEVVNPRRGTRTPRNGIVVRALEGTPLRAVAAGRVVFADWYKGFGLCVVTDHGGGDLSVLAHARRLLVVVGDLVGPGDAVGEVGDTGSLTGSQVYFQLNREGRPVDPLRWLTRQ